MNNLDVVKYAIASTSKYDYSLKQINKKYIQLIERYNEAVYKLCNEECEELENKYNSKPEIFYCFKDNILYVEAKISYGSYSYKCNGFQIQMVNYGLEEAKPLKNTLHIYEEMKNKNSFTSKFNNIRIGDTNLLLNSRNTFMYKITEDSITNNDIPLFVTSSNQVLNTDKVNNIKFRSEQLPIDINEEKNIFKKIFK